MANPNNVVSLYGTVGHNIKFVQSQGTEFAVRFMLEVKRSFRNKNGVYDTDEIPVKYEFDEARSPFAHSINPGDGIQLSGCIRREAYKGTTLIYVSTKSISFDEATLKKKYAKEKAKEDGDEKVSAEFPIDLPLPI